MKIGLLQFACRRSRKYKRRINVRPNSKVIVDVVSVDLCISMNTIVKRQCFKTLLHLHAGHLRRRLRMISVLILSILLFTLVVQQSLSILRDDSDVAKSSVVQSPQTVTAVSANVLYKRRLFIRLPGIHSIFVQ